MEFVWRGSPKNLGKYQKAVEIICCKYDAYMRKLAVDCNFSFNSLFFKYKVCIWIINIVCECRIVYLVGEASELFTGVLYNHYVPPPGFCFDEMCNDEPFMVNSRDFF